MFTEEIVEKSSLVVRNKHTTVIVCISLNVCEKKKRHTKVLGKNTCSTFLYCESLEQGMGRQKVSGALPAASAGPGRPASD